MNSFFRRLPLPEKLMLIGALPLAFLIYLAIQVFEEKTQKVNLLNSFMVRINQSANITRLIDELQTERRYSYKFALKRDMQHEMLAQRPRTDSAIGLLERSTDLALSDFPSYTFLKDLHSIRANLDTAHPGQDAIMYYYTNVIFRLNTLNALPGGSTSYLQPIRKDLGGQKLLSEMITDLGIIKSNIYNALYTRKYMVETLLGTRGVYDIYQTYETEFLLKGSPACIAAYKQIRDHSALKPTVEYINSVFKTFTLDSTYDAAGWEKISDEGVEGLKKLQQKTLVSVEEGAYAIYKNEVVKKNRIFIFILVAMGLVISFVIYIIRIITRMLTELKMAAQSISRGATGLQFNIASNDAIGSLGQSISNIDNNNKVLAEAAHTIGKGDFSVPLKPRSSDDLLGIAIVKMKDSLQQFTREIEESKEQFHQLADSMPQIAWTARADGYLDYYNKQWYVFTGFEEQYGDQSWIPILHPDDAQLCIDSWYHSVKTGEPFQIEYRFKDRKSGGYKWFLGKALPVKDENNTIVKWFGTSTDIQAQKMFAEELEQQVNGRTQDLKHANAELERSNSDLQQFAYTASHDLQEPVRKIRTFAEYIKDSSYHTLDNKSKEYISKISASAERMKNIINDLLNFASLNKDKGQVEAVDLNGILEGVKTDLELFINQKKAVINSILLPAITAIPLQMTQLFYNLINNSLKFTADGRPPVIEMAVNRMNKVDVSTFPSLDPGTGYYKFTLKDNGVGFDQKYAHHIFSMFQRLNTKKEYDGTGIGLALCKKIVENHKGEIYAQSVPGEGATFTVILPAGEVG